MIFDSIIDSLLLLTNVCFKVLLSLIIFFFFFFFIREMTKTQQKQFMKLQNFRIVFFTNHLKLVNWIPTLSFSYTLLFDTSVVNLNGYFLSNFLSDFLMLSGLALMLRNSYVSGFSSFK